MNCCSGLRGAALAAIVATVGVTRDESSRRALVVEDDERYIHSVVLPPLVEAGVEVDVAHNVVQAVAWFERRAFGLFVVDLELPGSLWRVPAAGLAGRFVGLQVIEEARGRFPHAIVAALTAHSQAAVINAVNLTGAEYIVKEEPEANLRRLALRCGVPQPSTGSEHALLDLAARASLSRRQFQVLRLLVGRSTDKEIAQELGISHHTVKRHVEAVLHKCCVPSRAMLRDRIRRGESDELARAR